MERYVVVMAGGSGTRLWPLSRKAIPKQCLTLGDTPTLFEKTIQRMSLLVSADHIYTVTTADYEMALLPYTKNLGPVLKEPIGRNTAPAFLLAVIDLYKKNPNAIVCMVPADHVISDEDLFVAEIEKANLYAEQAQTVVLLGVKPKYPSTEYGYIHYSSCNELEMENVYEITRFHEKPSKEKAQEYIQDSTMLWNTGIVCAPVRLLYEYYQTYAVDLYNKMDAYINGQCTYESLESCSFDKQILEKLTNAAVVATSLNWIDIGSLEQFLGAYAADKATVVMYNSSENTVFSQKKLVVLANVSDIDVIDTPEILFIAHSKTSKSDVLKYLREQKLEIYL